jgi:hypothetical protein
MANFATKATTAIGIGATIKSLISGQSQPTGSIRDFTALVRNDSLAPTNRFLVEFTLPNLSNLNARTKSNTEMARYLQLLCHGTVFPGVSLTTVPFKRYGVGMTENIVTGATVGNLPLTLYCDGTGTIQTFFYQWIDQIYGFSGKPQNHVSSSKYPHTVEYKSSYQVDMKVTMYNEREDKIITCKLIEAFPTSIGDINLDWGGTNEIVNLPIVFSYTSWVYENYAVKTSSSRDVRELNVFERAAKLASQAQVISALKKPRNISDIISITNNAKILINDYYPGSI